ncbi:MAG: general secretion pathway protein GspK [Mucispirillum sp.]|nr:general secretion pathway protein GspK [Mucispirillum sp.]
MNNNMKQGSILVTVLIIIAACTTLVLFIHEKTMTAFGSVITLQNDYQGAIYAMTAVEALEMAFQYDEENYDSEQDVWAQIPTIPLDNGFMTVYIKPLNAKVPLAGLVSNDEKLRERTETAVSQLLSELNLTEPDIEELKTWVGSSDPTGERFDENSAPYSAKSSQLQTLAELAFIESFKNEYKKLTPYVSIAGDNNKINLNLASAEVIKAYVPELEPYVEDIISTREAEPLKNVSALYEIMGAAMQDEYSKILPYIDVKSSLFYIKLELNIGDENLYYHLLVQRNGSSVTPVKYIEGNNIDYF